MSDESKVSRQEIIYYLNKEGVLVNPLPIASCHYRFNKLTSVFHVCPVIDHEFRHNIVKVAVDPRGDSRVDPQLL